MRSVSAPGGVALDRGSRKAGRVRGGTLLGTSGPLIRGPARGASDRRSRPGRARRQSDRAYVHRGSLRGLVVSGSAPGWVCQPAGRAHSRGRVMSVTSLHHRGRPLCAACEPPDRRRAGSLQAVSRRGVGDLSLRWRRCGAREVRLRSGSANPPEQGGRCPPAPAQVLARRRGGPRRKNAARLLPSEPAEYVHWPAHGVDVRCCVGEGEAPYRC